MGGRAPIGHSSLHHLWEVQEKGWWDLKCSPFWHSCTHRTKVLPCSWKSALPATVIQSKTAFFFWMDNAFSTSSGFMESHGHGSCCSQRLLDLSKESGFKADRLIVVISTILALCFTEKQIHPQGTVYH